MTDAEVFGKLSRIFETHGFAADDSALDEILEDFDPSADLHRPESPLQRSISPQKNTSPKKSNVTATSRDRNVDQRPTPYQVWHEKNKGNFFKKKPPAKLNGQQWDRLVEKMHQSNRVKQSAMIKEQNQGLAAELDGFSFKPRINKTSLDLSSTMKSLNTRIPEMIVEREKLLESKRKESANQEMAECTFAPKRHGAKTSDMYLKKLGREQTTPDDLFRYEQEKERRNEIRRHIVNEIEERELTFKPQLSEKSIKLQEKLKQKGIIDVDPLTRTTVPPPPGPQLAAALAVAGATGNPSMFSPRGTSKQRFGGGGGAGVDGDDEDSWNLEEGPMLQIESEHPYRHNTNEYTTVSVPGAVSYCIRFDERTRTEPIYDFVKFYDNETHTDYFGAGKYSGGMNETPFNWPGIGHRPPLIIPASKFIIHFKTNGVHNDWGFCIHIVPTLSHRMRQHQLENAGIPQITESGRNYQSPSGATVGASPVRGGGGGASAPVPAAAVPVHQRLYEHAVAKSTEFHNAQVDLLQDKLNIALKPWESPRSRDGKGGAAHKFIRLNSSTHLPKNTISEVAEGLLHNNAALGSSSSALLQDESNVAGDASAITSAALAPTVVEFDDSMSNLWKRLRTL